MNKAIAGALLAGVALAVAGAAEAQVKIGVTVSATGPAASLGIPEKNTIPLCPKTIAGKSVEYILLDDATDTTTAVQNTKKLIGENKVDAIIGSTTTPNSLAMIDVFAEGETPVISLASSIRIIEPMDAKKTWSFKTPQTDVMMAGAILEHAAANAIKTIGYIGFNDALGEAFFAEIDKAAQARKLPLIANERYAPKDTSVTGQVLKLIAAKPDAIVIGASGTPAALPARTCRDASSARAGTTVNEPAQRRRGWMCRAGSEVAKLNRRRKLIPSPASSSANGNHLSKLRFPIVGSPEYIC